MFFFHEKEIPPLFMLFIYSISEAGNSLLIPKLEIAQTNYEQLLHSYKAMLELSHARFCSCQGHKSNLLDSIFPYGDVRLNLMVAPLLQAIISNWNTHWTSPVITCQALIMPMTNLALIPK